MTSTTKLTAFVTGAAGFIGTALVEVLLARGHCGTRAWVDAHLLEQGFGALHE